MQTTTGVYKLKNIYLIRLLICITLTSFLAAQNRTALSIVCDTQDIPIYIDGHLIGYTPLSSQVDVMPGWHKVSFFPDISDSNLDTRKVSNDIVRLGTQDVLVETGEIVKVTMTYKNLGQDVDAYYKSISSGTLLGFGMIIALVSILVWAYV